MSEAPASRAVATVEELIQFIELTGLRTFEISGKRSEDDSPAADADTRPSQSDEAAAAEEESAAAEAEISVEIMESHTADHIITRFRATVEARDADFVADVGLRYTFTEPLDLAQDAVEGLLNRVAVMSAWPFIREAVATTAARMELEVPVLGLIKQGDFRVRRVESANETGD